MTTTYCTRHERAYIPSGYDSRKRQAIPPHWVPLSPFVLRLAWGVLRTWGGCALPGVTLRACDQCGEEVTDVPA